MKHFRLIWGNKIRNLGAQTSETINFFHNYSKVRSFLSSPLLKISFMHNTARQNTQLGKQKCDYCSNKRKEIRVQWSHLVPIWLYFAQIQHNYSICILVAWWFCENWSSSARIRKLFLMGGNPMNFNFMALCSGNNLTKGGSGDSWKISRTSRVNLDC